MKAELSVDEMDTLADFRARLEAQLEIEYRKRDAVSREIGRIKDALEIIDKIIDGEVEDGEERQEADARAEEDHEEPRAHP